MFGLRVVRPTQLTGMLILPQEGQSRDSWTRELGGASAKFEDGAAVSAVSLPSDFSAVRLNNLPLRSSPASVAALLSDIDVAVSAEHVRVTARLGAATCSADLKVDDPLFAKTLCSKLRACAALSHVEAIPVAVPMPQGSNLHRVDCRKVHCSWHRPSRTAWLNFGTEHVARRVAEKFNAGVYKVLGCHAKAGAPTGSDNQRNRFAWTVMLTDLDTSVREQDVRQAIPEHNKPRRVSVGSASYGADADTAAAMVESMLLEIGPLELWVVSANSQGKRIKAQARFVEESHAREALSLLDNKPLSFKRDSRVLPLRSIIASPASPVRLTVRLMTSAKFKVSTRVYDVLRERLASQTPVWESQHIRFTAYPPQNGCRVLKLESEDRQQVAQAKATLERIIGGEVARKDGQDLWSMGLGRNGDEYRKLKKAVEQDHGVVIIRDIRKSQLRLFGPEASCTRAAEAIVAMLQDIHDGHAIELSADEFVWACRGGFAALTAHLGNNKAAFDIVSRPTRILISGSKADHAATLAFIASRQMGPAPALPDAQTDCSVCWTEAEEPIRTSCDHTYCAGCLTDMCQAKSSDASEFRISCVGDQARCKKTLPLPELQDLLPSAAFENLLEASFATYIRQHPAAFRYCPTPDCGQIYRAAAADDMRRSDSTPSAAVFFTCAKCLIPTCTACNLPHPGMTCADHKDHASGGYAALEKIKTQLGIKDCPKCKTAMEKVDGCNHMTCGGCRTHLCWVCMHVFGTATECYAHLRRVHGGPFDVPF